jgi:hypothetical protein
VRPLLIKAASKSANGLAALKAANSYETWRTWRSSPSGGSSTALLQGFKSANGLADLLAVFPLSSHFRGSGGQEGRQVRQMMSALAVFPREAGR